MTQDDTLLSASTSRREVLDAALRQPDEEFVVRDLMRPIHFVPESKPANELLELFIEDRAHIAAVIDEYGGFEGVVTLEDVLECLLGAQIVDEHDEVADMQSLARERSRKRRAAAEAQGAPAAPRAAQPEEAGEAEPPPEAH